MADILIVDDQDRYAELCRRALPQHRYRGPARCFAEAVEALGRSRGRVDLVLLDVHFDIEPSKLLGYREGVGGAALSDLKRRQGLSILQALRARYPDLPVILMTSRDELALEGPAERLNAEEYTYFLDDEYVDARALSAQIEGILDARRGQQIDGPIFWGRSMVMRRVRQRLSILARGRLPVVLLGPTGTGKSLLARHFVHPRSGRKGRFVSIDLSTVPAELMAAHLFGSVKGAYTGSVGDRTGAFELAQGGTLFIDEVGNLSLDAQKMLLTVLQEGMVTRIGDLRERPVDAKVVVATNQDLAEAVREGTFRSDLYMRLNPATAVVLPALSERALDLDALLRHSLSRALEHPYLRDMVDDYRSAHGLPAGPVEVSTGSGVPDTDGTMVLLFPERSMRLLRAHPWTGNLREFAMVAENTVLFALAEMTGVSGHRPGIVQVRPKLVRDMLTAAAAPETGPSVGHTMTVSLSPQDTLNKVAVACERQYFRALFLQREGNFGAMAEVLLGSSEHARKVQLRFNQLGLKVRELNRERT
jgi:DNA-binding NtrC family response regulator